MAFTLKGQSVALVNGWTILSVGGGLHVWPDAQIPPGDLVEVTISEGGDHAVYWAKSEDDDTHKVLVLEVQGDIRNALMVPASAVLNAPTANVSITQVAQENFEGLEADLPIAVLQAAEIEPITPPVIQVDLPFNLNE